MMPTSLTKGVLFSKFEGAGNDFIIIDDLQGDFPVEDAPLIHRLCDRQLGVGADGLILVCGSSHADYKMRIFNKDGYEAPMCGNGLRCFVKYLYSYLREQSFFKIESARGVHLCHIDGDYIRTELGSPKIVGLGVPLEGGYIGHVIDTGVPHVVIFVSDIEEIELIPQSRAIRYHSAFHPEGVNVNFACHTSFGKIVMRTYERGVEGETLACGTGAAAVAIAAYYVYGLKTPVEIVCRSQEKLTCYLEERLGEIVTISLQGPARHVFDGQVALYPL